MSWFTSWFGSPYYKILYGHRDTADARPWVEGILERTGMGRAARVLDMGCGRGRHAHWFTEAGLQVTGIDISAESIAEARVNDPVAEFHVHDMRLPYATGGFDLAVCLFTSFGYWPDRKDDQRVVHNAARSLRPGGWFVLDFMNTVRVGQDLVREECIMAGGVRFHIARCWQGRDVVKTIEVDEGDDKLRFEERVHGWTPGELVELVEQSGLVIRATTDGPPFNNFDPDRSDRTVIWSQLPA